MFAAMDGAGFSNLPRFLTDERISELGPAEWLLAAAALGVVVATSGALKHANHQADTALKDKASDKPCIECGEIPCFPGGNGPDDRAETQKELDEQQKFINDLSPEEMDKRLADAQARKDDTGSYRPENDAQDRTETRNDYYKKESGILGRVVI
ncbi:MAG: hypothetical protein ABF876_18010 [Acetobacter aceti]|uniref:Uncharacterized protein n=1 Tax=Acetobacter aceti TaxID=435 RepID=A0A1U9KIA4_ACEAC|nr:hypothetical protein [Acetobacter aceti]AQS85520.1 hypothetical protein A0U92_12900 [Acetobacter aceti]